MPDRSSPLFHITPNDVKLLVRPNEKGDDADPLIAAWEALINHFFAMAQIMRLCTEYEQINKSPFASYHQHALVSPDTLSLIPPDKRKISTILQSPYTVFSLLIKRHKQRQRNGATRFMHAV